MGQVLELRAHSKTNSAIKALLGLVPPVARVIRKVWKKKFLWKKSKSVTC